MPKQHIPIALKRKVYEELAGREWDAACPTCHVNRVRSDQHDTQAGHIWMESLGGPVEAWNIIPQCKKCNLQCKDNLWDWMPAARPGVPLHPKIIAAKGKYMMMYTRSLNFANLVQRQPQWNDVVEDTPRNLPLDKFVYFNPFRQSGRVPLRDLFDTDDAIIRVVDVETGFYADFGLSGYAGWKLFEHTFDLTNIKAVVVSDYICRVSGDQCLLSLL